MERRLGRERRVPENHSQYPIVLVKKSTVLVREDNPDIKKMHRTGRVPRSMQFFKTDAF